MEHDAIDNGGLTDKRSWDDEQRCRWHMCKKQLLEGTPVQYKSGGNSLYPLVHANDSCLFAPVVNPDTLKVGDIVFCEVQPGNRFFAHLIKTIEWENCKVDPRTAASARARRTEPRRKFTIGNISGHINGHCFEEHIYGRLVEVVNLL